MKKILVGLGIVLLAFFFRFNNLNWDSNFHLHPDERFLTMVGNAMKLPATVNQYFDQETSQLNPINIGYNFFVYGRFPLIVTKYLAVNLNLDDYNNFTILGRQLSALFDILIVIFIFKTVLLLEKSNKKVALMRPLLNESTKYWAAFFYAIAVLPIQLSHFFAVDTFLNFFMFGSFYFALRVGHDRPLRNTILSAIFFGLALSCKVTAVFILPLNLFFIIKTVFVRRQSLIKTFGFVISYFVFAYFTLRFTDPYLFQNKNLFDPTVNSMFIDSIKSLQSMTVKNMNNWFPPMVQWLSKNTVLHSLINNVIFGMGFMMTSFVLFGIARIISNIKNQKAKISIRQAQYSESIEGQIKNQKSHPEFISGSRNEFGMTIGIILLWVIAFFIYQSIQVTPTLRYFIIIYPFLAIFAAVGVNYLINFKIKLKGKYLAYSKVYSYLFIFISVLILLIWPLMFSSIYSNKNSRVEASEWIYKNLPDNSVILGESWDDWLPMGVINNYGKQFTGEQLPIFDPDTPEKWQKINQSLGKADYYILSSNRGWGSIPTVPEKYPLMSNFYNELLENRNPDYKKIREFTSYPSLRYLGIPIDFPDQWSDEGFTVYDHQKVLIFKNVKK